MKYPVIIAADMGKQRYQILLTNDDGIKSPGLWAAAEALSALGYVTVAAPREQSSGAGRSLPVGFDGRIQPEMLKIGGQEWKTYAIGGTPAAAVMHGVLEVMDERPDLIVSGINYGENPGSDITMSGTVGAAIEGASLGIPSIAISLQLENVNKDYLSYSSEFNFPAAAHFTRLFAGMMLEKQFPGEVELLNINVPHAATPETPWRLTRLARYRYFNPYIDRNGDWNQPADVKANIQVKPEDVPPDSDIRALIFDRVVSVTPLTLDMTARVNLAELENKLKKG